MVSEQLLMRMELYVMKTGNFPGKKLNRQKGALERLKGPDQNDTLAMARYEIEKKSLIATINAVYGLTTNLRSKKNRTNRAKVA